MIIAINRTYGTKFFTVGVMTVPGTEFKCKTLELRAPEHSRAVNKARRHAVPCGDYRCFMCCTPLMIMTPRTERIKGGGRAILVDKFHYRDLAQGEIILCSSVDSKGEPSIVPAIADALSSLIHEARMHEGEAFEVTLSITEDADYVADEEYVEQTDVFASSMDFTEDE